MSSRSLCWLLSLLCFTSVPLQGPATAPEFPLQATAPAVRSVSRLTAGLDSLIRDSLFEHSQVALCVYDLTADSMLYSYQPRQTLRPASTQKVITAVTALELLGPDYELQTRLYTDRQNRIYVCGGYDPLLDEADLRAFAQALRKQGMTSCPSPVVLDYSFKDGDLRGWGWCWDDDTVPLSPLLYRNRDQFSTAFSRVLHQEGLKGKITFVTGRVPAGARLLSRRTHGLREVLQPMMKESNNSMAESVFYQIGAYAAQGAPANRKAAAGQVEKLIRRMGFRPRDYQVADGSGLSLYNYTTPELMTAMLRHAYRQPRIYRALLESLPIAGVDGTLERRMRGTAARGNVCAKTGSVEGVSTLAGYCTDAGGHRLCFSIMNQGVRRLADGRDFQDRVCELLCR